MRALRLIASGEPLVAAELSPLVPGPGQLLVDVHACGVCRTDLHVFDGELRDARLPLTLGHEVVGRVRARGPAVSRFALGARVGVPWLGWTCGVCRYCVRGAENLCEQARFTGYTLDGGYAEQLLVDERYCFPLPDDLEDVKAAPLLCAGLIGYRSLRFCGDAERIGLYGFGAAAHIVAQVARFQGRRVYAFVRPGDRAARQFASQLGAEWVGDSTERPPEPLDAAILYAPIGGARPHRAGRGGARWPRRLRRHSHERHPSVSL